MSEEMVSRCTRCAKPCFDPDAPTGYCTSRCAKLAAAKKREEARAQNLAERATAPLTAAEVCAGKRRFPDEASANAMTAIVAAQTGRNLEAYECGDHWHHMTAKR